MSLDQHHQHHLFRKFLDNPFKLFPFALVKTFLLDCIVA